MATINGVFVEQDGAGDFLIHQYKNFIGTAGVQLNWKGKGSQAASGSPIYLQVYNRNTVSWQTLANDSSAVALADVTLTGLLPDPTNYIDSHGVLSSRIYQEAF